MFKTYCYLLITGLISLLSLVSCNNDTADIAFPASDTGYLQPVSQPLQLSKAKKMEWLTVKTGGIRSVIKKLDIDALPSTPYDTSGFRSFAVAPEESRLDFNTLPDTAFNLEKIKSVPLKFQTLVLPHPVIVRASSLSPRQGTTLAMSDIGKAQGIAEKAILCLMKDRNGFIWIGTQKSLYRYDGEYMQRYQVATQAVCGMIEDNEGRIWVISQLGIGIIDMAHGIQSLSKALTTPFPKLPRMVLDDKGRIWATQLEDRTIIAVIDPQTRTYKNIGKSNGLTGTGVWTVFQDKKKNIWVATNGGADIINAQRNKITYLKSIHGLGNDSLRAITEDSAGLIWIAYQHGGVNGIDIKNNKITRYGKGQGFDNALTYRLASDNKGQVWMATDHGLFIVDPRNAMSRSFKENDGIAQDYVLDLLQDDKQKMWAATFNAGVVTIEQNAAMVHPVGSKTLSTLLEDNSGKMWVGAGTSSEGIEILDRDKKLARQLNKQHGLADNFIQNFAEVDGNIWIATDGGFDIIDITHKTIEHTGKKEGLTSDTMYAVLRDKAGSIWFSGPSLGVDKVDSARTTIQHAGAAQGLSDENIVDMKTDKQGRMWIATFRKGVDIIDPEKGTIQNLNQAPGLRDTCYRILMPDDAGNMWIGSDKGVYVANTANNTLVSITTKEGLCNNYITSLLQYKGTVVAGTRNKVSIITPPGNKDAADTVWKVALLAGSEGLVNGNNSWSTNIITRKGQYIWGDAGITTINEIKELHDTAVTYITGVSVMTQPLYFTKKPALSEHDTLWTADSFYVKGQFPQDAGFAQQGIHFDSVEGPYNLPVSLHIPYDQNYMQFQFAQHHPGRQDLTQYAYVLQGVDKKWSAITSSPFTENYLNLSPGDYIFKVRSKSTGGAWSPPASFNFTITPPWWKTWWAYTLLLLVCAAVLRAYIVYRSRKLQRENKLLEEKVTLRTKQLQQSIEDLKATQSQLIQSEKMASLGELTAGIAHEIQNPLNFINNFSDVNTELIADMKEEIGKGNMEEVRAIAANIEANEQKINHHGKRADSIVKGMLQHSRSGSRQKEPTNISALADEYFRLAYHGLRAKDKSFNALMKTEYDERLENVSVIPQDIGRVILNLITNAFYAVAEKKKEGADKVSGDKYEPTVWVSTKKSGDKVLISVKDNGNGIPQKVLDKIFQPFFTTKPTGQGTGLGLSLSYDIVHAHAGELKVQTREGEGSEFIIQLPLT